MDRAALQGIELEYEILQRTSSALGTVGISGAKEVWA
jgi:hypothetical protein